MIFDIRECKNRNIDKLEDKILFEGTHTFGSMINSYYDIPFTTDPNKAKIFPINIKYMDKFLIDFDIFTFLGKEACKQITSGNAILVFYFAHEAIHFKNFHTKDSIKFCNSTVPKLLELGISLDSVWFVTGDLNCTKTINTYWDKINMVGIDFFSYFVHLGMKGDATDEFFDSNTDFKIDKEYDYLYLNGNPRPNKCILYHALKQEGLLKNSLYSWLHRFPLDFDNLAYDLKMYSEKYSIKEVYNSSLALKELDASLDNIKHRQNIVPYEHLSKTSFSLIPETFVFNDQLFITEKTYKPILYKHPFLLWGNTNLLKYLKQLGYETYSEIFDESYDSVYPMPLEKHRNKKMGKLDYKIELIINNIKNFKDRAAGKEKIINDICKHNRNHFLSEPSRKFNKDRFIPLVEAAGL